MRLYRLNVRLPMMAALSGAAVAIALAAAPSAARAADDGRSFEENIIHNLMMGLGLRDPNAVQPTYEERSPLVLPKSDALPPPQRTGAAAAKNPAWPKDPDVARAKARAKAERERDTFAEYEREHNQLLPDQLGPTGSASRQARANSAPNGKFNFTGRSEQMSPSQLGFHGTLFDTMFGDRKDDDASARFTGEPARTSLTEPPPGYQTPSPNQPYGLGKEANNPKAENSYLTKGEINANTN